MVVLRKSTITIDQGTEAVVVFQGLFSHEDSIDQDKEHFYVMHLDARRHISLVELVAIGTLDHTAIHPRETYRRAVIEATHSILVAHNHPSGDVTPSEADITTTTQLHNAGQILNIPLLDHLIITANDGAFFSFQDNKTQSTVQTPGKKSGMKKQQSERG